ncbi:MAG: DUF2314 domain-containing protein [Desulfomonilaceae bacterium]|nr:DUF2314 domain-containing protein [Desulfomonilaceae bacterium]
MMVRLRCPECGYLQTLSEERFLSISDDFLTCPHCRAHVPKQWEPESEEAVPDEVRHKMQAFSRRILNGGNAAREVVHALESLVRRHGPVEESIKALGVGYAHIGETRKAESFLIQALSQNPHDPEALHSLMEILMSLKKYNEAVEVGRAIIDILGRRTPDEDVAFLAMALAGLDRKDEALALMDSFPDLAPRNQVVKQARRELTRGTAFGLAGLLGETGPLHRLFKGKGRNLLWPSSSTSGEDRSRSAGVPDSPPERTSVQRELTTPPPEPKPARKKAEKYRATLEYWIYAPAPAGPEWEDVMNALGERHPRKAERERIVKLLESLVERNDLTVDYILKEEAGDLFDYPEDLIPQNSRDLSDDDREVLLNAEMIVRIRLSLANYPGVEGLVFMVRFVEAVRGLTGGVVQDAISHTLWGTEMWKACVVNPKKNLLESHVQFEALDEGGVVWIHSHGMQKFGLPDLEIEGIPSRLTGVGHRLVILIGETLVGARDAGLDFSSPFSIPGRPIAFKVTTQPRDEEGHFPSGSLKIHPYVSGGDPGSPDAILTVLASLQERTAPAGSDAEGMTREPAEEDRSAVDDSGPAKDALRNMLLKAHRKARNDLPEFKKSFQETRRSGTHVHAVKVGFPAQDGEFEWMWVSLDAWRGKSLVGHVENNPVLRKDLQRGSRVQINEGQIFDWVVTHGGEIVKGPYTEDVEVSCRVPGQG